MQHRGFTQLITFLQANPYRKPQPDARVGPLPTLQPSLPSLTTIFIDTHELFLQRANPEDMRKLARKIGGLRSLANGRNPTPTPVRDEEVGVASETEALLRVAETPTPPLARWLCGAGDYHPCSCLHCLDDFPPPCKPLHVSCSPSRVNVIWKSTERALSEFDDITPPPLIFLSSMPFQASRASASAFGGRGAPNLPL